MIAKGGINKFKGTASIFKYSSIMKVNKLEAKIVFPFTLKEIIEGGSGGNFTKGILIIKGGYLV